MIGRAGQGGYGTVQHAYDTRLKRDVAIKCIQITQADMARSRISIHDAQIENASRALSPRGKGRKGVGNLPGSSRAGRDAGAAARARRNQQEREDAFDENGEDDAFRIPKFEESGFKPLIVDISEPGFFSMREKNAQKRARRRGAFKEAKREAAAGGRVGAGKAAGGNAAGGVNWGAGAGRGARSATDSYPSDDPFLNEFAGYKNFKGGHNAGRRGRAQRGSAVREFTPNALAGGIPGMIAGAGKADINAVGENSIAIGIEPEDRMDQTREFPGARGRNQASPGRRSSKDDADEDVYDSEDFEYEPEPEGDKLANVSRIPGLEEARTAAHLNDVNIVTVYDCVVEGNMAYVIMEYVEGKTLARIMRDLGNDITLDMIASVFTSVSHALEVAHNAGILHLDIKPENVIINGEGTVKVTDFGLSTLMDASGQGVTGGGTIGYMPLEQMRQQRLDVRTDEWALASLTYEMLSGKNPFKARTLADAEAAILNAELVIPSLCWEQIDESIDDIMFSALSPTADGRYPDIDSFASDLTPLLGSARDGKEQLAKAVEDPLPVREERAPRPEKPHVPLIDVLGVRGSNILMRAFSVLGAAMLAVIALMNFRFGFGAETGAVQVDQAVQSATEATQYIQSGADTTFGLFSILPIAAWIVLAVVIVVAALWPGFGMPAAYGLFVVMLFFNQAFLPGMLLLAATGAWWWFYGRQSDMMCTLALMQPLLGSFGFGSVTAVLTGAILDVQDAVITAAMLVVSGFAFASLGSADIMNWDVMSNFIVAVDPSIAGASITAGFAAALSSPYNWVVAASWVGAAGVYSLLCRKGTHAFDVLGSVASGAIVLAGALVLPIATGEMTLLTPNVISGVVLAVAVGIVLALMNVPDRVRMAPGEW